MRRHGELSIGRRPATDADIEFLEATHMTALSALVPDQAALRQAFHDELQLPLTDVITCDDIDTGYLVLEDHGDIWWIEMLAIAPAHQGKGIGTAVLEALIADAPVPVQLSVLRRNSRARALYERLGFRVVAEEEKRVRMSIG